MTPQEIRDYEESSRGVALDPEATPYMIRDLFWMLREIAAQLSDRNEIEMQRMELLRESNDLQREGLEHSYKHSTWQAQMWAKSLGAKEQPDSPSASKPSPQEPPQPPTP